MSRSARSSGGFSSQRQQPARNAHTQRFSTNISSLRDVTANTASLRWRRAKQPKLGVANPDTFD
ncbi:MAG: hypothetical protein LBC68_13405 [Prevotellaceae bacterium]|nr:hypothetical protein [Prevotellaceae bacterium]